MLTASGARFGFARTLPHVAGVVIGVGVTSGITGLGLGALLLQMPQLTLALKCAAAGWILWMAYKLLRSARLGQGQAPDRPFTLLQAALFQWINPKVWAVALAAAAGYSAGLPPLQEAARLGLAFARDQPFRLSLLDLCRVAFAGLASQSKGLVGVLVRDGLRARNLCRDGFPLALFTLCHGQPPI